MRLKTCLLIFFIVSIISCDSDSIRSISNKEDIVWEVDRFKDVRILRYEIPGFEKLNLDQKKLVYYLTQAGLAGRDIIYDQNYRHNLAIRKALEEIILKYRGDRKTKDWIALKNYAKQVWFANGIHHHYSMDKFHPDFSLSYFNGLCTELNIKLNAEIYEAIFNPNFDNKKVNLDPRLGLLKASAVNFYSSDISSDEVEHFYENKAATNEINPVEYGLNSRLIKNGRGEIVEEVYRVGGKYSSALTKVVEWLKKAKTVSENNMQLKALELLIKYYETGDLKVWDQCNIAWLESTAGDVDYINGFIEVYNDPMGYKGSFESIVEIKDFEASERMGIIADNAQWFEDNSPIRDEHKKENVVGISYKVVNVAGESGDASPATPIGVNLPNSNWIRAKHGSKSVSLGNIIDAYSKSTGSGVLEEFAHDQDEIDVIKEYGELGDKMSTALHEVIGHASGKLNPGVGTPKQTLKSYASTLEEARADIVALYFILDEKLIDIGVMPNLKPAIAEYDSYISNGLMRQLRRIEFGKDIEESHMRNRQMIATWAFEKGKRENIIERVTRDGKTFYNINDYNKLRIVFGEMLTELQRIKSEGDYDAGKELVEKYGVKVDPVIHKEVLERSAHLKVPAYSGFINPKLEPVLNAEGEIIDIQIVQPKDFETQMLEYAQNYSNL